MLRSIQPLQFLLTLLAGWINRRQLEAIEYLKEENRLLKERLGGRRLRFTDAERRRLATDPQTVRPGPFGDDAADRIRFAVSAEAAPSQCDGTGWIQFAD